MSLIPKGAPLRPIPALLARIRLGCTELRYSNTLAFLSTLFLGILSFRYFKNFKGLHTRGRLPALVHLSAVGGGDERQSAAYVNIMSMV
jgi:hypothetical protein